MKTKQLILALGMTMMLPTAINAQSQSQQPDDVMVEVMDVTVTEVDCKPIYSTTWSENWFLQLGAGINMPFVENSLPGGDAKRKITLAMNVGVGRWFSPYMGFRFSALGGALHWENGNYSKAKYANLNLDFMWDMMNSVAGVNPNRVFSINPFVGLGGTYTWDINSAAANVHANNGKIKDNTWTLPVSAGIQFRFRTGKYVDIFMEARSQFYADNFNGTVGGKPVDVDFTAVGGLSINLGGVSFTKTDPCAYLNYMQNLNDQVNELRGQLSKTNNELAAAKAQLPCPDPVVQVNEVDVIETDMPLATVRFTINSAKISNEQMVNVYNMAQWLEVYPDATVTICGYADDKTGSSEYNMKLSERRAKAVYDALVNQYGVDSGRLTIQAFGSETQPYETNNWNRIVIFRNN
ncbi:MAG: OmpA family protein [Muribaculaceae bacterium]|nr:OmpA family protein [Muribaculaceae bacterium]